MVDNDLVHESCSRTPPAVVYEACSEDQRKELVSSLLATLWTDMFGFHRIMFVGSVATISFWKSDIYYYSVLIS